MHRSHWYDIVTRYTSCHLTYSKNILPALQGVAKTFLGKRQCAYYAGLWESTLCSDLLWAACKPCEPGHHTYRAPSWSWASVNGPVHWPYPKTFKEELRIVLAETTPAGEDPMGEVTAGSLKVRATDSRQKSSGHLLGSALKSQSRAAVFLSTYSGMRTTN
jgi:hypothetical protein